MAEIVLPKNRVWNIIISRRDPNNAIVTEKAASVVANVLRVHLRFCMRGYYRLATNLEEESNAKGFGPADSGLYGREVLPEYDH